LSSDLIYWDIRPRSIVQPYDQVAKSVVLEVVGSPDGDVGFSSTDPAIAGFSDGILSYGGIAGAAVVVAEAVRDGIVTSRRYLQVDVQVSRTSTPTEPQLITDITTTGYVEELPGDVWHFKYFTDWFDQWGCNIRVQGELAITLELDRHYWLYFDVWGAIESFGAHNHDTLDLYLNDRWKRNFNPPPVIYPAWDLPCVIERRTAWVDLWEYIGRSVIVRFKWDTRDALYQMFDGWYVGNIRIVPPGGG